MTSQDTIFKLQHIGINIVYGRNTSVNNVTVWCNHKALDFCLTDAGF